MSDDRKRVLFVMPTLYGRGGERVITHFANHLNRNLFEPILLILRDTEDNFSSFVHKDVKLIKMNLRSRVRYSIKKIIHEINRIDPEFVFLGSGRFNLYLSIILPLIKRKRIFIARETNLISHYYNSSWILLLYRIFYKNFDMIIVQSDDMLNDLSRNLKLNDKKIVKINNPVDVSLIKKLSEEAGENVFSREYINLLAVGELTEQKAFDKLIDAFSRVDRTKYRLYIIGKGHLYEELINQVKINKLEGSVFFLGFQKNPYFFMKRADFLVLSSNFEGFPNVLLEAMVCGCPILSNNCPGGINEIVKPINGKIFQIENLNEVLSTTDHNTFDKELIKIDAIKRFSTQTSLKKLENILHDF